MIVALLLAGYAAVLAVAGPRLLARAAWMARSPRLGVAAWQALSAGIVVAALAAGLALTVPSVLVSGGVAQLLRSCVMAVRAQYAEPGGALIQTAFAATGAVLVISGSARVAWCLARVVLRTWRERRRQFEAIAVLARFDAGLGVAVVDHDVPVAYCLPGRRRRVVVSSAALTALDAEQLRAVLAHEREHLRARHDLVLIAAETLALAFPRLRVFADARQECARLLEMCADDAASSGAGPLTVAEALLCLGSHPAPVPGLAANATATAERIRRLISGPAPLARRYRWAAGGAMLALLVLPVVGAAGPALAASKMNYCPLTSPGITASAAVSNGEPARS